MQKFQRRILVEFKTIYRRGDQRIEKRNSRVTLVGFSPFGIFCSKTRKGRNPQSGDKIKIKGKNVVKFKPGKTIRNKVQTIIVYQDILKG